MPTIRRLVTIPPLPTASDQDFELPTFTEIWKIQQEHISTLPATLTVRDDLYRYPDNRIWIPDDATILQMRICLSVTPVPADTAVGRLLKMLYVHVFTGTPFRKMSRPFSVLVLIVYLLRGERLYHVHLARPSLVLRRTTFSNSIISNSDPVRMVKSTSSY